MKLVALLFLAGCTPKPEEPSYFIQRTITREDGATETWTYTGPKPPPQWERTEEDQGNLPDVANVR